MEFIERICPQCGWSNLGRSDGLTCGKCQFNPCPSLSDLLTGKSTFGEVIPKILICFPGKRTTANGWSKQRDSLLKRIDWLFNKIEEYEKEQKPVSLYQLELAGLKTACELFDALIVAAISLEKKNLDK